MSLETDVDAALDRVECEREHTAEKRREFERFEAAVENLEPIRDGGPSITADGGPSLHATTGAGGTGLDARGTPAGRSAASGTTGAVSSAGGSTSGVSTAAVLEAFDEHLTEYSGDPLSEPESVHEAVAEEFSTDLASALCSGATGGALTPSLKAAVLEEARSRRAELRVTEAALAAERASLATCADAVDDIVEWFVEHNPTPLSELGFERLRAWHERLDDARERLDEAAGARQAHLHETTTRSGAVGVEHDVLAEYLYAEFADGRPALATIARLAEACEHAQRAIRDHLVRRV